jgi:taurine dioxygenase
MFEHRAMQPTDDRPPRRIAVLPTDGALGADVQCGPLQALDDQAFAEVYRAWLDHLVLRFRGQRLSDPELIAFTARFGAPMSAAVPGGGAEAAEHAPAVHVVSNVIEDGVPIGILGAGHVVWHTDMAAFATPPTATILHALEVPGRGGDTRFNNTYLAHDTLPVATRRQLLGLTVKHAVRADSAGPGTGARHPIVCTHPETGCDLLFLGARFNTSIAELPRAQSDALLDAVWDHATRPELGWAQAWREGDVVVWDNRCVLHARDAFDPRERRVLHRTQVAGTVRPSRVPVAAAERSHPRGHRGRRLR